MPMELANPKSGFSSQHARTLESLINTELPIQASCLSSEVGFGDSALRR